MIKMRRFRILLLLLFSLAVSNAPAVAQQAVWDPEEIARLAEKAARMAEALSRATELLNNVNDLTRTIGRFGTLSVAGITRFDVVEGLAGAGPEIGSLASNIAELKNAKIRSFDDASAFVKKLTTVPQGTASTTNVGKIRQAIDALHRKALEDGYALSAHTRESLSVAPQRAAILVSQASTPADMRGDLGANTAASLAVFEQLCSTRALLASILEIQATKRLMSTSSNDVAK